MSIKQRVKKLEARNGQGETFRVEDILDELDSDEPSDSGNVSWQDEVPTGPNDILNEVLRDEH